MSDKMKDLVIWGLIAVFALFNAAKPVLGGTPLQALVPAVSILSMLGFVLLHGPRQMGWKPVIIFFLIASVISWGYESLSIMTGFPFGNYHYTDKMGPKLGLVPLLIMPAYFAVCYISIYLARIVLDRFDRASDNTHKFLVPVVAMFIMVMWDMSMDPSRSTMSQSWIWHDGGGYFGVPFVNFLGWALCVWTIFQVNALVQVRLGNKGVDATAADRKVNWWQTIGLYAAIFVEFPSYAAFGHSEDMTDATGKVWNTLDMFHTLGLVSLFTMLFVIVLTTIKLTQTKQLG